MAHGAPDWVLPVQVTIVEAQPADERAAGDADKYSGTDQTYQALASWTVATDYVGELKEILIISDNYAKTHIKIVIGAITWCTDWNPQACMPVIFEDLRLAAAAAVTVSVKSTDGTSIEVDGTIVGKEVAI